MTQRRFVTASTRSRLLTASEKSRHLLYGAYLYGEVMDSRAADVHEGFPPYDEWLAWQRDWPGLVDQAKAIQSAAFDWCVEGGS